MHRARTRHRFLSRLPSHRALLVFTAVVYPPDMYRLAYSTLIVRISTVTPRPTPMSPLPLNAWISRHRAVLPSQPLRRIPRMNCAPPPSFITDVTDAIVLFSAFLLTGASFTALFHLRSSAAWSPSTRGRRCPMVLSAACRLLPLLSGRAARCRRPRAEDVPYLVLLLCE